MAIVMCCTFIHFLIVANREKGVAYDRSDKIYLTGYSEGDGIFILPFYWVNIIYCVYFLYILLLIFGILKIELNIKRKPMRE